jgi:hemerythrin-like domain-containing protein
MSPARPPAHPLAASLKPLIESLRGHILREEAQLFPLVEGGLTSEELEGLRTDEDEFPDPIDLGVGD